MFHVIRRSRGAALIIVLAVLAVLALMATALLLMASADRNISMNYMDKVRAGRVARSGVAAAAAALAYDPFDANLTYYGNDENQNGHQEGGEDAEGGKDVRDVDLDYAQNPSMAVEVDKDPTDKLNHKPLKYSVVSPEGRLRTFGVSGWHSSSTYGTNTDVYQVRISESSGKLHLNDGAGQRGGNQSSVSQNLRRMLNILGSLPTVSVSQLGDRVLAIRPADGFSSITELEGHFSAEELVRLRPFVTTHSWVDKNVANPVPLSAAVLSSYPVKYYRGDTDTFRRGRGSSASGGRTAKPLRWYEPGSTDRNGCAIYGLDELNPSYVEIVHRAPVNVNSARREVLIALLSDLQGFFVGERRAFSPYAPSPKDTADSGVTIPQKYYSWWTVGHSYDDRDNDGDEYGFLYRTPAITRPRAASLSGSTTTDAPEGGVSAETLADHIIACRDRGQMGGINYRDVWFNGEFKTWNQFYRFVDHLVEKDVIKDTRSIFFDYDHEAWESPEPRTSRAGQKFASYALADVIKANFNPNLHLNELNPDANLYLRVDKTDLIVNSTEFTFKPTGVYEIESIGRVLKPLPRGGTGTEAHYTIEAERRVCASVRVFDTYRETSQRHFTAGRFSGKDTDHRTNSGSALEFGPEPDPGAKLHRDHFGGYSVKTRFDDDGYRGILAPETGRTTGWGYEFDGYITLTTYGGRDGNGGSCSPHWPVESGADKEGMHVHFSGGFEADFNSGLETRELACGETSEAGVKARNHPDHEGDPAGPLCMSNGTQGAHRLARSFRLPGIHSPEKPPLLTPYAPGDLRTDGFYSERNAGAAYLMQERKTSNEAEVTPGNFALHGGAISLWIKPSFFPEHTGKMRNIVSMSKTHDVAGYRNPSPFNLSFVPAHDKPAYSPSEADEVGKWAPPGGFMGNDDDPPRPKGGPIAPKCEYKDPFSPMYDGNIPIASQRQPTETRSLGLGVWQLRPASLLGYRAATTADAGYSSGSGGGLPDLVDIENYALTSCLNHNLHSHGLDTGSTPNPGADQREMRPNYIEAHRWTHVLMSWQTLPPW